MDLAPDDPITLGPYRVRSRLGAGAMGLVLLGVDDAGRRVALRVVPAELAADPGFRERFRREVELAASAPAWFTAPVLDANPDAERPWLATAYVEGPSLRTYVTENGPLGVAGVAALAVRMADGLVALHAAGLVHRDLTPSNVLLADDGPRLIDVGISRAADALSLARTGRVMGTPEYMSPEQAGGARDLGLAGDVFAFGSVLVFAASGRSPFAAGSVAATLHRIGSDDPDLSSLSGRVAQAAHACLRKDPAERPTAGQVRGLLRAADAENQVVPDPTVALPPDAGGPVLAPAIRSAPPTPGRPFPPPGPRFGASPGPPAYGPTASSAVPHPARRAWLIPAAVAAAVVLGLGLALALVLFTRATTSTVADGGPPPAPTPPSAGPTATAPPSDDPNAGAVIVDAETDGRFGTGEARFTTPSKNIACLVGPTEVRCDVAERSWSVPPTPADCPLAYGNGAVLTGPDAAMLSCVGDTVADPALVVLPYGRGVRFAGSVCVSRESGVRCVNSTTGHGFRVSRASYDLF